LGQPLTWVEVVQQVAGGTPSPFAVDEVRRRSDGGDGQAVELLAWMHANGVGVRRDLPRAFNLYVQAGASGIEAARENASAVFRSMSVEQRALVKNPFN
jgi:TPR repeat protein